VSLPTMKEKEKEGVCSWPREENMKRGRDIETSAF